MLRRIVFSAAVTAGLLGGLLFTSSAEARPIGHRGGHGHSYGYRAPVYSNSYYGANYGWTGYGGYHRHWAHRHFRR